MPSYEIKVLSSDEFDEVARSDPRYEYVDDSNMGFADRDRGLAFVRDSNIHDLNKYLIEHELEELESDESTHEDPNGIRHKKFFKDLFLPAISGGMIKPESIQREAAQTTNVPGVGNVLNSQLQQQQSYNPFLSPITGGLGAASFLNPISGGFGISEPATSRLPESATGSGSSSLFSQPNMGMSPFQGIGDINLPPEVRERQSGNYSGRLIF